ncbi:MAG: WG repeat-containing protein [Muribaculaceae bacterium]|nr:WG repeat-containing protein [Muribaculaceae bacterium]
MEKIKLCKSRIFPINICRNIFMVMLISILVSAYANGSKSNLKRTKYKTTGLYGFVNEGKKTGWWALSSMQGDNVEMNSGFSDNWRVPAIYDDVSDEFCEDLAAVFFNGHVGFIDQFNRMVIPPKYLPSKKLNGFKFGLSAVNVNGKYGYINKKGEVVIPAIYDYAENFDDNLLATVVMNKRYGAIDLTGDTVVPCKFLKEELMKFVPIQNKLYRAATKLVKSNFQAGKYKKIQDGIYSVAEEVGQHLSDTAYKYELPKIKPIIFAKDTAHYGMKLPGDTMWIVKPMYSKILSIGDGFYEVDKDWHKGIVDLYGRTIIPCIYAAIEYQPKANLFVMGGGYKLFGKSYDLYGLTDANGYMIIPPTYESIFKYDKGVSNAMLLGMLFQIDKDGLMPTEDALSLTRAMVANANNQDKQADLTCLTYARPDIAEIHRQRGLCRKEMDLIGQGIKDLSIAHELEPSNKEITQEMKDLKGIRNSRRLDNVLAILQVASAVATTAATIAGGNTVDGGSTYSDDGYSGDNSYMSSSKNGLSREEYQQQYDRWVDAMERQYNGSMHSSNGATYVNDKQNMRRIKKEMEHVRREASRHGYVINRSQWEDANVEACGQGVNDLEIGKHGTRPRR